MACFPEPGSVTVCEINRELLTDDEAKQTYAKILGMTFSSVQFEPPEHQTPSTTTNVLAQVDLQGLSWHPHKHIIAFISGVNQVLVRDYEDSEGKEACVLANESQKDVKLVQWRPNGGRTLAVACNGGICIWAASFPGTVASVRSSSAAAASSFLGTLSRGSGIRYTLVDFLRSDNEEQVTALSWSPDGRYLASGSYENSSFTIWDIAQGIGTPIRRGLAGISILKWSPTGDYFFSAKFDGTFYLWETNTWVSESWSSTTGFVKGASWDPDGHMILLAFSKSSSLGSIHFASKPPSLDAHLLPVELPEIMALTKSQGIEKMAWDASGERLAVSFNVSDELYSGLIAVYDVRRTPLISASLIGFIRGPGDSPKPISLSFHDKFKQGPLLSVARIKKIMQANEDVGKIALAVPVLVSKALELFLQDLCDRTYEITLQRRAKTMNSLHRSLEVNHGSSTSRGRGRGRGRGARTTEREPVHNEAEFEPYHGFG